MKKFLLSTTMICAALAAGAQAYVQPKLSDNWSVGVNVGAVAPLKNSFLKNTRPTVGLAVDKQITPAFALGAEGVWGVNTSRMPMMVHSSTAFDSHYIGARGSLDFFGFAAPKAHRFFSCGIEAGCGWGHIYANKPTLDHNFFATRAGMFFNFRVSDKIGVRLTPSFVWDLSDANVRQSSAAYAARQGVFSLQAGVKYSFGPGFRLARLYDPAEIDALNGEINTLRNDLATSNKRIASLSADLDAARASAQTVAKPEVIREEVINNQFNTVLDVFFYIGSASITSDQMPNVERIASYLKNHPGSRVEIKGYASRDGDHEANILLAQRRAYAVRDALILKYKIDSSRISAQGVGIGDMFEEDSWNRVSVCTLTDKK